MPTPWASTCSSRAAIANVVPAAAAIAISPMFSIDEYASIRLTSPVTVSISAATSNVASPSTIKPVRRNVGPGGGVDDRLDAQISTENATDSSTPLISADTGAGAWLCASASQVWNGTRPTLAPYPISSRPPASRVTPGSRRAACAASTSRFERLRIRRPGVLRGEVQQHRAQEGHRDADRADDHVLPRGLQRGLGCGGARPGRR